MTGPIQESDYINVLGVHNFIPPKDQWTIILRFIWTRNLTNKFLLSTNTHTNLQQHIRGAHGSGCVSPCGIRYSWPPKMFRHHKKCVQCQNIMKKKETGAEKLAKLIGKENAKKILKNQNSTMP